MNGRRSTSAATMPATSAPRRSWSPCPGCRCSATARSRVSPRSTAWSSAAPAGRRSRRDGSWSATSARSSPSSTAVTSPLPPRRPLFAEVRDFRFFDFVAPDGRVAEDVFAFANRVGDDRAVVVVHSRYAEVRGTIRDSVPFSVREGDQRRVATDTLGRALGLPRDGDAWIVYRDMVSGLEHLHSCLAIHERGLEFELHAYDRRVLLDWRILRDGDGFMPSLAERLGGRGVRSVDAALDELRAEAASPGEAPAPPAEAPPAPPAQGPRPRRGPPPARAPRGAAP